MKIEDMDETEARRLIEHTQPYDEPEGSGLFGSVKRFLKTTLAVLQSRLELFTIELKELRGRALGLVAWGFTLVFLAFMILVAIMATVVFALWEQALPVLMGFSGFFLVAAIGSFLMAKNQLSKIPFGETVEQLRKDRELLTKEL
ncbi:MAG: phage holin family protein [Verrucomicrobiota bacterium]